MMSTLMSPMQQMDQYKDVADTVMRSQIGRFGITGPQQTLPIKNLSDGLKSRVVLSWLAYKNPHMLLLVSRRIWMPCVI